MAPTASSAFRAQLPLLHNFSGATQEDLWPVAFALLLLTLAFISRFRRSRLGIIALMVQMNPALAASLGVDPRRSGSPCS